MDFDLPPYLSATIVGIASIVLFVSYLLRRSRSSPIRTAPFPPGAWPIVGHLPLLGGTKPLHKTLASMADKYGPIFTLKLGSQRALVLSNWELAKECFTTHDVAVTSRPPTVASKHLGYDFAMFALAPYGAYWRELRKIATVELLSNHRLELLSFVRQSEVKTTLGELHKLWTKKKNKSDQLFVDLMRWFADMNLSVILRMVAGKRYGSASKDVDEKEARRCQKAVREFFHYLGKFVVADTIPSLRWLDLGGDEKAMKKTAAELDDIMGEWLEDHKRRRASGETEGDQDFMDVMLSVLDGKNLAGYGADAINKATSLNMIAGGVDTNTIALISAISLLVTNPHTLKKAQDELDTHVGKERVVRESDISKLVYLQAIVKEALRIYPPAPILPPREFIEDCTIAGYHVPKGTRLIVNIWKIQTDPRTWPDPLEFKPERFLTTHSDVDVRGKHFELIPFGCGRRSCPGVSFGLRMQHLALASFLQMFEISTSPGANVDMSDSFGSSNMQVIPLEVLIKPRLPSELYE
ncbi:Cytochrome P450 82A4 [Morella rubra]|uniref:Cytochrome P450 82A4 n=1 Tax=Morella rubra TaxID=262757 RepID=A0A6A1W7Y8_9ROSI|nr:Cytochrome P450 82A4 [Morella rubra]